MIYVGFLLRTSRHSAVSVPFWAAPFYILFFALWAALAFVVISLAVALKFSVYTLRWLARTLRPASK